MNGLETSQKVKNDKEEVGELKCPFTGHNARQDTRQNQQIIQRRP